MRTPLLTNPKKWPISRRRSMTAATVGKPTCPTTVISGEYHLGTLVLSDRAHAGSGAHNVFLLKRMVSSSDDVSEGHLVCTVCSIRERGHYSMGCRWFTSRWP